MSIKILLADDSITIQKVVGIIFGGDEYSLTVVDNGKTAVEKAVEIVPDVMLIDAIMPGMTGYEVCEAIRSTPALAAKPILLLTGSFEPFDEEKAKTCGADDFLAKPFESQQIVSKVKSLFEQGASNTTVTEQSQSVPETEPFATPAESLATDSHFAPAQQPVAESKSDDIWGAFTPEPTPSATGSQTTSEAGTATEEPDVFAIVNEEPEVAVQPEAAPPEPQETTGSQWIPVEEQTFEFHEETVAELPPTILSEPAPDKSDFAFGEISFEEPAHIGEEPSATPPAFAEPPPSFSDMSTVEFAEPEPAPTFKEPVAPIFEEPAFAEVAAPAFEGPASTIEEQAAPVLEVTESAFAESYLQTPASTETAAIAPADNATSLPHGALTEEQLKAALAGVSKEIIERIVWEVVPDLAETLIQEAIRKIKEGL